MVARLVLGGRAAAEPADGALEFRRAGGDVRVANGDALPERDGRDAAGEVLRQVFLPGCEEADREVAGLAQQLVQRRVAADRDAYERRLQRERDEGGHREPSAPAVEVDGDNRDAGRKPSHERT